MAAGNGKGNGTARTCLAVLGDSSGMNVRSRALSTGSTTRMRSGVTRLTTEEIGALARLAASSCCSSFLRTGGLTPGGMVRQFMRHTSDADHEGVTLRRVVTLWQR